MRWVVWVSWVVLASCATHTTAARRTVDPEMLHVPHDWPAPGNAAQPFRIATGVAVASLFPGRCYVGVDDAAYCMESTTPHDRCAVTALRDEALHETRVGAGHARYAWWSGIIGWRTQGTAELLTDSWRPEWVATFLNAPVMESARQLAERYVLTESGELWERQSDYDEEPFKVRPAFTGASMIAETSGRWASTLCAIIEERVVCEGANYVGQAGRAPSNNGRRFGFGHEQQGKVAGLPAVSEIRAGEEHFCALSTDGELWCWGHNGFGQLGDGTFVDRGIPVRALDHVRTFTTGSEHTCAITEEGSTYCWGRNEAGQIGAVDVRVAPRPLRVDVPAAVEVAGDVASTCVRSREDELWCWGSRGKCYLSG